mmetsp:Transcript_17014/g.36900  ORF Transcript_17014/g.36900 Transcript_17014/m.36900 type:complete len:987 (-) Transcript_17014:124-3084(-)
MAEADIVIEKGQEDYREYRPLFLENGLKALLVHDSKCDKAAAALTVKVGSMFDPPEIPGLAHFLEHMLFLGTEKYPKEEEYKEFISQNGGSSNAFTAETYTNYHFSVGPDSLNEALDRFSQFFLKPLFNESATDRELNAVDSEHSKNLQSDAWRSMQLLRDFANPKHPLNHFGTGNVETLKETPEKDGYPVRKRLIEFYEKYYSANLMCLAVLGKESLDELAAMVRGYFSPIGNRDVKVPEADEIGGSEDAFDTKDWPLLWKTIPVKEVRKATFQFLMPQQMPMKWRSKPASYLSFCIGHEGKGSLLSCLKARGLVTSLTCGPDFDDAGVSLFDISVHLTEQGEKEVKAVGECIFSYINLLQNSPVSMNLLNELKCIEEMNFQFRAVTRPLPLVTNLASLMQNGYPIDKVMSANAKVWEFDTEETKRLAELLTCSRMRLTLQSKTFTEEEDCPETERWYGTRYGVSPLPKEWLEAWEKQRLGSAELQQQFGLALPEKNPFVAEDLALKPKPDVIQEYPVKTPVPGVDNKIIQVYFKQDTTFNLPKAYATCCVYSPWATDSPDRRIKNWVWCKAVAEELNEFSYDAEVAGCHYNLQSTSRGVMIAVGGYQDKLPELLKVVIAKIWEMRSISEHTWSIVHTVLGKSLRNAAARATPLAQAAELQERLLVRHGQTAMERLAIFEGITRESIMDTPQELFRECYCESILQGNLSNPNDIIGALSPLLGESKALSEVPSIQMGALPGGPDSVVIIRKRGTNDKERNGAVIFALQAASACLEHELLCRLAEQVLSSRCFDELRTKQNLGYVVHLVYSGDSLGGSRGKCGLKIMVQSELHPATVHRRIRVWLKAALEQLLKETDEELEKYLKALLVKVSEKPKNLSSEFARNYGEVSLRSFEFDRQEQAITFLQRDEVLREFRKFVEEKLTNAPKLVTEVRGSLVEDEEPPLEEGEEDVPYNKEKMTILETLEEIEAMRQTLTFARSLSDIEV